MIKDLMMDNVKTYEELMETLKAEKQCILKDVKKVEKAKKTIEKLGVEVQGLEFGGVEDKTQELERIERDIKMCKSIIRRYHSVLEMYDCNVDDEEIKEEE